MKNFYGLFLSSSKELKNVRNLVITGLLMTIGFILHFFNVQITPFLRLSFGFITIAAISSLYGPTVGGMCGGISDIINYISTPNGPYFPGFTISGICTGIIYAIILYNKKATAIRCSVAVIIVTITIDILLNTFWLSMLYGTSFYVLFPVRAMKELIMLPIKIIMTKVLLNLVNKIKNA